MCLICTRCLTHEHARTRRGSQALCCPSCSEKATSHLYYSARTPDDDDTPYIECNEVDNSNEIIELTEDLSEIMPQVMPAMMTAPLKLSMPRPFMHNNKQQLLQQPLRTTTAEKTVMKKYNAWEQPMKLNFLTVVKIALHSDTRTTTRTPTALLVVPKLHWKMPDSVNYAIAMSVTNLPQNVPVGISVKRV